MNENQSAQVCGCDKGAHWTCEQHRLAFGDCVECDGYIMRPEDIPYCPTCARLKHEAAAAALRLAEGQGE